MLSENQNDAPAPDPIGVAPHRRATDAFPEGATPEILHAIFQQLNSIAARQRDTEDLLRKEAQRRAAADAKVALLETAFPRNDLGAPDYEGHRNAHKTMIEAAKTMESYKVDMTKRVLAGAGALLFTLLFTGAGDAIRKFITGGGA